MHKGYWFLVGYSIKAFFEQGVRFCKNKPNQFYIRVGSSMELELMWE